MKFEWDENKNKKNIRKHGLDFNIVKEIFKNPMLTALDTREDYGEERHIGIGYYRNIILVVVFTESKDGFVRIISARRATKNESKNFQEEIKKRFQ